MSTCYIVCSLDCNLDFVKREGDLLIAADKGYLNCVKQNLKPDVAIGDFDSYTGEIVCDEVIKYPIKKDFTDSKLAVEYATKKGYKDVFVYGAIGGLLDHTIANIALCAEYIEKGICVVFVDDNNCLFAIKNTEISFDKDASGRISVFSFTDNSYGVTEKGLMYNVDEIILENKFALGVSNEFVSEKSKISVKDGILLIYTSKNNYQKHLKRR